MRQSPVWHPFTQHLTTPPMRKIMHTEGAYLIDEDGRKVFDAISSWWVITHGHRYPPIMEAVRAATESFDQIIFAEYTHEPAEQLARGLIRLAPPGLAHVFYSDSGSTAVEVAVKMALGFFHNTARCLSDHAQASTARCLSDRAQASTARCLSDRAQAKNTRIAVMEHGYHGDTIGTMSAGDRGVFNAPYGPLLYDVDTIPFPHAGREQDTLDAFERYCRKGDVAALLVEPLVLGAGGMLMYPPHVLVELKRIAEQYNVLFIADEVMTGWGRTGTLFACEQAGITPDILCLSKGITGGALPLAATLCTAAIFDAHLSTDRSRTFFHSSSYTANPIACAAALANLRVWETEPVRARIAALADMQRQGLKRFEGDPRFTGLRQKGTIAALDLNVTNAGYLSEAGPRLRAFFRERNLLIRPLGNVIYLMPPYCTTAHDLNRAYDAIDAAAEMITKETP